MLDKQNKEKRAADVMNAVSEILMLGRGLHYGIWIVTQRADAALFANGSRDNFMCILALGRLSKEQKICCSAARSCRNGAISRERA